jgi:hypothetical protein
MGCVLVSRFAPTELTYHQLIQRTPALHGTQATRCARSWPPASWPRCWPRQSRVATHAVCAACGRPDGQQLKSATRISEGFRRVAACKARNYRYHSEITLLSKRRETCGCPTPSSNRALPARPTCAATAALLKRGQGPADRAEAGGPVALGSYGPILHTAGAEPGRFPGGGVFPGGPGGGGTDPSTPTPNNVCAPCDCPCTQPPPPGGPGGGNPGGGGGPAGGPCGSKGACHHASFA